MSRDIFPDDATFEKIEALEQKDHNHIDAMIIQEIQGEGDASHRIIYLDVQ